MAVLVSSEKYKGWKSPMSIMEWPGEEVGIAVKSELIFV